MGRKKKEFPNNWWGQLRKFWDFVWNDDSLLSWVLSIIFAFIIIKFIVYPTLGLMLSTSHPVVAIISGSMEHKIAPNEQNGFEICGNKFDGKDNLNFKEYWDLCGSWYEKRGISKYDFVEFPFDDGMNIGDVIVLRHPGAEKIEVGDIIVFIQPNKVIKPIIHRVVNITNTEEGLVFQTKGDHNVDSINSSYQGQYLNEYMVTEDQIIGKSVFRIPLVGYIKILAYDLVMSIRGIL